MDARRAGVRGRGWSRALSGGGAGGSGRWSPRSPAPFSHHQSQPSSVAGDREDVCGSGSNCKEGRKTCLEDDDKSKFVSGSELGNSNKNMNMNKHDDNAMMIMMPQSQCTSSPAALDDIEKKKDAYSATANEDSFDICHNTQQIATATVVLKPSLLITNRERRRSQIKDPLSQSHKQLLRPGMLLLKAHISLSDQVKIVKICREFGVGTGGFYQPGYQEGTKLHLKMMCLGKHWDPQSCQYTDHRPCDGAKPPLIPPEFHQLVQQAITYSHAIIQQDYQTPEEILPPMSPDICIVNFYSQNGRLGLHQDKDESPQSLQKGLPVVSFSIGDSADFLYGDDRDVDKAQKLLLESGDVLIFGGGSRNLFHGVSAIHPKTAPSSLLHQTNLRPGRLNLTFRQY